MHPEQEQKNDNEKKPPLFKIIPDPTMSWTVKLSFLAGIAIVALMYVLGIYFKNSVWTMFAFVATIVLIVIFIYIQRKKSLARRIASSDAIDAEVEQYKKDLIDTYDGYDIAYSKNDIQQATDEYRKKLELRYASIFDVNVSTISSIIQTLKSNHSTNKATRSKTKRMMKEDKKIAKKEAKSQKKSKKKKD